MTDQKEVLTWIEEFVKSSEGGILGSALAKAFRDRFPGLDLHELGFANLKAAALSLPEVQVAARSGMDVIYKPGIRGEFEPTAELQPTLWSVWAQPRHKLVLAIDSAGTVEAVSPGSHSLEFTPFPTEGHRTIAEAFLSSLLQTHELKPALSEALQGEGPWWPKWLQVIQHDHTVRRRWNEFRVDHLIAALKARLQLTSLSPEAQESALRQVTESRRKVEDLHRGRVSKSKTNATELSLTQLRNVVKATIDLMDENTINQLQIPPMLICKVMALQQLTLTNK